MKESAAINSSLMTLGRCMEALRYNQSALGAAPMVVPYRESKVRKGTGSMCGGLGARRGVAGRKGTGGAHG